MYVIDNWGHGKQGKCAKGTFYKPRGTVRGVSKLSMSVYKSALMIFKKKNLQHNYQKEFEKIFF